MRDHTWADEPTDEPEFDSFEQALAEDGYGVPQHLRVVAGGDAR